jgi:hypothetical protein
MNLLFFSFFYGECGRFVSPSATRAVCEKCGKSETPLRPRFFRETLTEPRSSLVRSRQNGPDESEERIARLAAHTKHLELENEVRLERTKALAKERLMCLDDCNWVGPTCEPAKAAPCFPFGRTPERPE